MGRFVITGAARREDGRRGIGAALEARLREEGHEVITVDRANADLVADLSLPEERARVVRELHERAADGLDGLATCAAVGGASGSVALVEVNFFGTIELIEGCRDLLRMRGGSAVIVSSHTFVLFPKEDVVDLYMSLDRERILEGVAKRGGMTVYASGKRALVKWMREQVASYAGDGIRLNTVVPGYTDTPLSSLDGRDETAAKWAEDFRSKIPLGQRMGRPEEVAAGIAFMLSPDASFVCGSVLYVDGGHDVNLRPGPIEY
ncbi:MAG: SDR family oxidoreductase [Myxococcota bacterium]|nr:SDR family oxidoreductase [Myxococcota bacterium]